MRNEGRALRERVGGGNWDDTRVGVACRWIVDKEGESLIDVVFGNLHV